MAITIQYRVTIRCDVCGKRERSDTVGVPPAHAVPADWIQTSPAGESQVREFCSSECLVQWEPTVRPWEDDDE